MALTKNIIVFYHENCLDGFAGAYVTHKKFKEKAEYIPLSHNVVGEDILKGKKIKISDLKGKQVFFIDFCLNEVEIKRVEKVAKKLVVIDHHIGMKDLVESLANSVFRNGVSGSYLAHEYFFPNKEIPRLIKYISIGDTYTWGQEKYEQEILNYINTSDFDFKIFAKLEKDLEDKKKFLNILKIGKIFNQVADKQVQIQAKYSDMIEFDGYKAIALNSTTLASQIGNYLCEQNKNIDFVMIYRFSEGLLKVSLRGKGKVDLARLAKKYGGGGHFNASSFKTRDEKFIMKFLKKVIY